MSINFTDIPSPAYVLEEQALIDNLRLMQRVQDEAGVDILLALKGFAMFGTFDIVKKYLSGATASSLNEARLCVEEMGSKAHLCCPAYLESEWEQMCTYASHITFNSLNQWKRFKDRLPKDVKAALRINPEYSEVEIDLYNPCVAGSRLGIRAKDLGNQLPDGITGLHFHALCENDSYVLERTLQAIEENYADLLHQAQWFNLGGGHLMTRKGYDVEHLIELLKAFKQKYKLQLILEPGSAVAWQTGFLLATVVDVFDSGGIYAVILDASVANHMPDCIEMPYTPTVRGAKMAKDEDTKYRLGGMTCLAGDYVGDYAFDTAPKIGDQLIFEDMMHYTMVKNNTFNGINLPSIGIWRKEGKFELLREFGYEDYKGRLS